ncbi:hypothetical protein [Aquimarina spongiae]|uniref:Uncharacterized protein n=1 Tax=Aquimarina spongiae TaxID=570521 RepID=A0A1M6B7Y6_9FLAO|nr:hypothetical protein [Aquimarina spongiae]SHI44583.1 hypothetical protein SAMN04488508_101665 [Aquimarina spongiae]
MDKPNTFELIEDTEVRTQLTKAYEKIDQLEIIQLLSDLKYLPQKTFEYGIYDNSKVENAIKKFRHELSEALAKTAFSNLNFVYNSISKLFEEGEELPNELSHQEFTLLKELTGLDKELEIYKVEEEQTSLLSRVLIYRFHVYDLAKTIQPNHKMTTNAVAVLQQSAEKLGFDGDIYSFGNLLADQENLSKFCLSSPILTNNIFLDCIFISTSTDQGREVLNELGNTIKRKLRFQRKIASQPSKTIISKLINFPDREAVKNEVKKYIRQDQNRFLSRVLQVKLWTMGLYYGRLDHDFGPLSITALSQFLMTIVQKDEDGEKELGRIMYNLKKDQCIINIRYLLKEHFIPTEVSDIPVEQSSVSQIFDFVLEDKSDVNVFSVNEHTEFTQQREELTQKLKTELNQEAKLVNEGYRTNIRQYKAHKGIMRFFSKIFKFVRNAIRKLRELFKKLFRIIKKVSKIIFNEIKDAFQSFSRGIEFLFGDRIVQPTAAISSDYDFDFDGVTRIHSKPSKKEYEIHIKTIREYASAIYSTLNFTRIVIKWGIRVATGPISWVQILVGIAKLFREMIRKRGMIQGQSLAIVY